MGAAGESTGDDSRATRARTARANAFSHERLEGIQIIKEDGWYFGFSVTLSMKV